jgi:hypothetical protein
MIEEIINLCVDEDADGILLFSEIGTDFYNSFGFTEVGSAEFLMELDTCHLKFSADNCPSESIEERALSRQDVPWLARHYLRWLRTQPFGVLRSESYWYYKLSRENFLKERSRLFRPELRLTKLADGRNDGYAITEHSANTMRVLEVIGSESAREVIWMKLFERASELKVSHIRGWESMIRDFEPNYEMSRVLPQSNEAQEGTHEILCVEREWGRCMIMPVQPAIEGWLSVNPCPLLELDFL